MRYIYALKRDCSLLFILLGSCFCGLAQAATDSINNKIVLQLSTGGPVIIEMQPDIAPKTVSHIKDLVKRRFYDGLVFHRVIDGFMAQTGDPTGTGAGGSGTTIPAEFNKEAKHVRSAVSLARTENPNSGDSQFFIMLNDAPHLNGRYTLWGHVVLGMEYIDKLPKGDASQNGMVRTPGSIVTARLMSDTQQP